MKDERTARYTIFDSPIGPLTLASDGTHLTAVRFARANGKPDVGRDWRRDDDLPVLVRARTQLDEYFAGRRRRFDLPLAPHGTAFQREVWRALQQVGFSQTSTYGALAAAVGRPEAARAVGAAMGANPIPIIVPCHRIIGRDGSLTGFGGGLERKTKLLQLEGVLLA
ncbi:MAG: methylated-DNA--[protein]-cysteine S-methyltransferase [Gemmatimonadota bacterium]